MAPWSTLTLEGREKHSTGRRPPRERSTFISFNRLGWCVSPKQFKCPSFLHSSRSPPNSHTPSPHARTSTHPRTSTHAHIHSCTRPRLDKPLFSFQLIHPLPQPIHQSLLLLLQRVFQVNLLPSQLEERGEVYRECQGIGAALTGSHREWDRDEDTAGRIAWG